MEYFEYSIKFWIFLCEYENLYFSYEFFSFIY
jgi:hypothetical protein